MLDNAGRRVCTLPTVLRDGSFESAFPAKQSRLDDIGAAVEQSRQFRGVRMQRRVHELSALDSRTLSSLAVRFPTILLCRR